MVRTREKIMKSGFGFVAVMVGIALLLAPGSVLAQGGGSGGGGATGGNQPLKGSVVLKGLAVTSHSGASKGVGQVIPLGGYYIAPAVACTANISGADVPDGTTVMVTLEYVATSNLPPVVIGSMTVVGGKATFSSLNNPTSVSISAGFNTMSIRLVDGTVIMNGAVKGL
jgi:hypothetical protein